MNTLDLTATRLGVGRLHARHGTSQGRANQFRRRLSWPDPGHRQGRRLGPLTLGCLAYINDCLLGVTAITLGDSRQGLDFGTHGTTSRMGGGALPGCVHASQGGSLLVLEGTAPMTRT